MQVPTQVKRYKLAVFDIDGTLIDTERTGVLSLIETIKDLMGFEMPYEEAYRYFGIPSAKVGAQLGYGGEINFGDVWEKHFIELYHLIAPFPEVDRLLESIKAEGIHTGIVTSRSRYEFNYDQHLAGLLKWIDVAVCAEDTERHKPYPDPLLECISRVSKKTGCELGISDCLFLGDTDHDFRCAEAVGCDFALADWQRRGWQNIPADHIFTNADEALSILTGQSK